MQHPRTTAAAMLAAGAMLLSACADADNGVAPDTPADPQGASVPAHAQGSPPDRAALARAVPAFGGIFLEDGAPNVYLTETDRRPQIARALGAWLAQEGYAPGQLRVRQGRFAYGDLQEWFEAASREVFAEGEVVLVDLHEGSNRVLVGVESRAAEARVRAAAARAGVPDDALVVEVREPIRMLYSLRDAAPAIVGGLQINFPGFLCTLGFPAVQGGAMHFVTNSHCTANQGGVDDTPYWQPLQSVAPDQIGTEVKDPEYTRSDGCPRGRVCRFSDASLAVRQGPRTFALGKIADVPVGAGAPFEADGELTISQRQTSAVGNCVVEGTEIHKVGRTTGHTLGDVTNACVTVGVSGTNIAQRAQVIVEGGGTIIAGGDSGSPAFTLAGGTNVKLEGIVWGGSGGTMVFSPLPNIEMELGALDVLAGGGSPTNQPPQASFTVACEELVCAFTSTSTDSDGTIDHHLWDFGDGGTSTATNPTHEYASAGEHTVELTVTDDDGATDTAIDTANPTSGDPGGGIALSVSAFKVRGIHNADLTWTGATSTNVDIHRDGNVIATTSNDGAFTDNIGNRGGGSYDYQVCEAGTATCSNVATAVF